MQLLACLGKSIVDNVKSIADGGTTQNYNSNNKQKLIL